MHLSPFSVFRFPFLVVVAALLVLAAVTPSSVAAQSTDYLIGPRDVLAIAVWDQADLSAKYTVEADGSFTFPLLGRVRAGGLTLKAFEAQLRQRLIAEGFFKNPQVTVAVDSYSSQRVFVVGEVRQPGTYTLTGDMSLIEALSKAGSTTTQAGNEAVVVRAPRGKAPEKPLMPGDAPSNEVTRVDLKQLQEGDLSRNVLLKDGDTVYVPKAEMVYVTGQVKNPGAYALQTRDTTVLQAVALAGGATDRGASNRIRISRIVNGKKVELKVNLTDLVQPGDTVVVPERYF
jgi:polysaccharide biosynthesis/export protein